MGNMGEIWGDMGKYGRIWECGDMGEIWGILRIWVVEKFKILGKHNKISENKLNIEEV
jgi:hypothetical protein